MIEAYLNQALDKIEKQDGYDAYGKPKYVIVGTDVPCRWQGRIKLVRDKTGKEVVAQAEVWTRAEAKVDYRLTYQGQQYTVISVAEVVGLNGDLAYRKVYV